MAATRAAAEQPAIEAMETENGIEEKDPSATVLASGKVSHSSKSKTKTGKALAEHVRKSVGYRKAKIGDKDMADMMNRILMRELLRVSDKKKKLKIKKAKRKRRNPTDKQRAQWSTFGDTVRKAKQLYYAQDERTPKAWNDAMKKASGKLTEDAQAVYDSLVEGLDETTA